jgi:hypothetical protein
MQYRADPNIAVHGPDHHRELVLARLQKPQCYPEPVKFPRQLAAGMV